MGVELDYAAGQPVTTDVTVTNQGRTVFSRANSGTDGFFRPRTPVQDVNGVDVPGVLEPALLTSGTVEVAVAQANAADPAVTVKLILELI